MNRKILYYILSIIIGLLLGWILFHSPNNKPTHDHQNASAEATIWTCSMHPQIRMDKPGKCPICGMELIPLNSSNSNINVDPTAIHLSAEAVALANVHTSVVTKQKPIKEVRLYGKVQADERLLQSQVAHIPGRIEKLMVNFTGEEVRNGQTLALIYSPQLVTAQQELLEAAKTKDIQPEIYEASREKLMQWMLTEEQIYNIEKSGRVQNNFEVYSNTSGIVTARRVNTGDHIAEGTVLFDIADLSRVWVMFDAYESDLLFLNKGNNISFDVQALPGTIFSGKIIFIDPVIDPVTRVSKVRVEINNNSGKLKPEMFVTGIVNANLREYQNNFIIPRSSVLWTGKRSVVYVKQSNTQESIFKVREIELGPMLGNSYVVLDGLKEGEEIVTQGTFSVDAAAQLEGKPSMMNLPTTQQTYDNQIETPDKMGKLFTELNFVFDQYIQLKNALVESDPSKAKQASSNFEEAIAKIDIDMLSESKKAAFLTAVEELKDANNKINIADNIEQQRKEFIQLSSSLYKIIKSAGLKNKIMYHQFCPMANEGKGAYWLSETKEIRNPFYGASMLTCGETKETLKY